MTDENAARDEVAIAELDQRYASLRLVAPDELGRVRTSIERMGILSPVLVATAVEAARIVLVDGFKRVRIATDRGDTVMWVRRAARRWTRGREGGDDGGERGPPRTERPRGGVDRAVAGAGSTG